MKRFIFIAITLFGLCLANAQAGYQTEKTHPPGIAVQLTSQDFQMQSVEVIVTPFLPCENMFQLNSITKNVILPTARICRYRHNRGSGDLTYKCIYATNSSYRQQNLNGSRIRHV